MVGVGEALMIIQRSELTLQAARVYQRHRTTEQTVRAWVGDRPPPDGTAARPPPAVAPAAAVVLKAAAVRAAGSRAPGELAPGGPVPGEAEAAQPTGAPVQGRLATIVALIEWLTGQPIQVLDPADLGDRAGTGQPGTGQQQAAVRGAIRGAAPASAVPARASSGRISAGWGLEMTSRSTSPSTCSSAGPRATPPPPGCWPATLRSPTR
jgi:hypothetical protein